MNEITHKSTSRLTGEAVGRLPRPDLNRASRNALRIFQGHPDATVARERRRCYGLIGRGRTLAFGGAGLLLFRRADDPLRQKTALVFMRRTATDALQR